MICNECNRGVAALFPGRRCLACHLQLPPKVEPRARIREKVNVGISLKPQEPKRRAKPRHAQDLKEVREAMADEITTNHKSQTVRRRKLERIGVLKMIESKIRDLILKTEDKSKIAAYLEVIEIVQDQHLIFRR